MSQGGYVTLVGFVAREPNLRTTKNGRQVADVRVGATTRIYDKTEDEWRDGETSYYTVNCWRRLADHVRASLRKGDPVLVRGRFKTRTFEDKQNRIRTEVEIVADTIGHDLSRGPANYIRPGRSHTKDADDMADTDQAPAVDDFDRDMDRRVLGDGQLADGDQPVPDGLEAQRATEPEPEVSREPAGASVPF